MLFKFKCGWNNSEVACCCFQLRVLAVRVHENFWWGRIFHARRNHRSLLCGALDKCIELRGDHDVATNYHPLSPNSKRDFVQVFVLTRKFYRPVPSGIWSTGLEPTYSLLSILSCIDLSSHSVPGIFTSHDDLPPFSEEENLRWLGGSLVRFSALNYASAHQQMRRSHWTLSPLSCCLTSFFWWS